MKVPSDVVRSFIAAWNANDIQSVVNHLHPEVIYHNIPVASICGRAAVHSYLTSKGGFDWVNWQLLAIAESGNKVLTERIDDFGIGGASISLPVMGTFEIEGELIRAWRDYFDLDSYRRQLPATMPPPGGR